MSKQDLAPHNLEFFKDAMDCRHFFEFEDDDEICLSEEGLRKITPANVRKAMQQSHETLYDERFEVRSRDRMSESVAHAVQVISDSNARPHMPYCAINTQVDLLYLRFALTDGDDEIQDSQFIEGYLDRAEKGAELLTKLFKVDLLRRLAKIKQDPKFIVVAIERLISCRQDLESFVDEVNNDDLRSIMHEIKKVDINFENVDFYNNICMVLAKYLYDDFNNNQSQLLKAAEKQ